MPFRRLSLIAAMAMVLSPAHAEVLFVDDDCPGPGDGTSEDPFCSIQPAIEAAADGDEIIVFPGVYVETINFLGKAVTLRSSVGRDATTIDGQRAGTVVTCSSGEGPDTVMDGFTITGGVSGGGGGMINDGADPTVVNCAFLANDGGSFGGGMYNRNTASPTITGCVFAGNHAQIGGAMLHSSSTAIVRDCLFLGNSALVGGGTENLGGAPTYIGCSFIGNAGPYLGGGTVNGSSDATMINCLFAQNSSSFGGAVANSGSAATLVLINCTITGNTAAGGGGIHNYSDSPLVVDNCILWGNSDQLDGMEGVTVDFSDVQGGWRGAGVGNIDADPLFVDAAGGDFGLAPGSPCIDAADNAAIPARVTSDLEGTPRFLDVPETPDSGAGDPPITDMGALESLGGSCLAIASQEIVCHPDALTFTVNVQGLSSCTESPTSASFTASGGAIGEPLCFTVMVTDDLGGVCCVTEVCVTIPDCAPTASPCDLDGDGLVGAADFIALLAAWGSCIPCGDCPADIDGDCDVGITDMLTLLADWS